MRKIALVNQKGGVGKTTTAVNLGAGLARLGKRVILIDVDPQANATLALGLTMKEVETSVYEVLRGEAKASDAIVERIPHLLLLPSRLDLAGVEMELAQTIGRETVLREAVKDLPAADYLIVDCPPSLGLLNINALTCVDEVFIPMQCEFFALQGIAMLTRTIGLVQKRLNPGLRLTGVIPCMYDARKGLAREVVAEIERHFGASVFRSRIRANVRLAESPSHGKTIFEYAPESNGAHDYMALAREVAGLPAEAPRNAGPTAAEEGLPPEPPEAAKPEPATAGGMPDPAAPAAPPAPEKAAVGKPAEPPKVSGEQATPSHAPKPKPKTIPPTPGPAVAKPPAEAAPPPPAKPKVKTLPPQPVPVASKAEPAAAAPRPASAKPKPKTIPPTPGPTVAKPPAEAAPPPPAKPKVKTLPPQPGPSAESVAKAFANGAKPAPSVRSTQRVKAQGAAKAEQAPTAGGDPTTP
jgi:chromosome partitioning protein